MQEGVNRAALQPLIDMAQQSRRTSTFTVNTQHRDANSNTVRLKTSTAETNTIGKRAGSFQRQQSSNASDADNLGLSPAFLRSRFSNAQKPAPTGIGTTLSPSPQLHQQISQYHRPVGGAHQMPFFGSQAVAVRKPNTSHGGMNARRRHMNGHGQQSQAKNCISSIPGTQIQIGKANIEPLDPQSCGPMSTKSTTSTRVQQLASDLLRVKMPSNPRNNHGRIAHKYCTALDVMNGKRVRVFRPPGRTVTTPNVVQHDLSRASYMSETVMTPPSNSDVRSRGRYFFSQRTPMRMTSPSGVPPRTSTAAFFQNIGDEPKHVLAQTYDTEGIPMYANLLKVQAQAESGKQDFIYGGWTRSDKPPRNDLQGTLDQIIPNIDASIQYTSSKQKLAERALRKAAQNREREQIQIMTNFQTFTTKGQPNDLVQGLDEYTQTFNKTFRKDREQAKTYALNRLADKIRGSRQRTPGHRSGKSEIKFSGGFSGRAISRLEGQKKYLKSVFPNSPNYPQQDTDDLLKGYRELKIQDQERIKRRGSDGRCSLLSDKDESEPQIIFNPLEALQEFEKRLKQQKNAVVQVEQVKEQLLTQKFCEIKSKPQERYAKAQLAQARKRARKARSGDSDSDHQAGFDEGVNQITHRLQKKSIDMRQNYRKRSQGIKIDQFFSDLKQKDEEIKAAELREQLSNESKSDSFQSKEIYSENGQYDEEEELAHKRDVFMRSVEKKAAKQLGLKGYGHELHNNKTMGENDRMKVMAKLFSLKKRDEDQAKLHRLQEEHKNDSKLKVRRQPSRATNPLAEEHKTEGSQISQRAIVFSGQEVASEINMSARLVAEEGVNMMIEVADLKSSHEAEQDEMKQIDMSSLRSDENLQEIINKSISDGVSGSEKKMINDASDDRFFQAYRAEGLRKNDEDATEQEESSAESSFVVGSTLDVQRARFSSERNKTDGMTTIGSSDQAEKHYRMQDKVHKICDDQKYENSVMFHQLQKMIQRIKFNEIMAKQGSGEQSGLAQTQAFVFQKACNNAMTAILPIIEKIENGKLILQDYRLTEVQLDALSRSIENLGTPVLTRIFLDNCKVSDIMAAHLLTQIANQQHLQELIYKRNELMDKALNPLLSIVQIQPPQQLQELRLVDCATTPAIVQTLICSLADQEYCYLRSLSLVQMKINFPLHDLARIVTKSTTLQELDISGNDAQPLHFTELLKALAFNKVINNVNLSWNKILDSVDWNDSIKFKLDDFSLEEMLMERDQAPRLIHSETLENLSVSEMPRLVVESIGRLIRYNKNIQCIAMDNTGMNAYVLCHLVPYLRHSKSLLCFHLAQNPGINTRVKEYWRARLNIAPKEKSIVIDVKRDRDDLKRDLDVVERSQMTQNEIKIRDYKQANFQRWLTEETEKIIKLRQKAKINRRQELNMLSSYKQDLTISRILGHKKLQKGSGQWHWNKKFDKNACWHCGNWVFTVVLWNQEIGIQNANNNINIESGEKTRIIDLIRTNDPDYMANENVPVLFSNITNWKGRPFMRLVDFVDRVIEHPRFHHQAMEIAKENFSFSKLEDLKDQKRDQVDLFISEKEQEFKDCHRAELLEKPEELFQSKYLRYGKVLRMNEDKMGDPLKTFILPIFIKPGRAHFILRAPSDKRLKDKIDRGARVRIKNYQKREDAHYNFYYNRHIVGYRIEKVPVYNKVLKINREVIKFDKATSVFAEWRPDLPEVIDQCLWNDFDRWKIHKICRENKDLNELKNFFKVYFAQLKEIRIGAIAYSGQPPQMTQRQFKQVCELAGITEKAIKKSTLECLYYSTNYETEADAFNNHHQLVRYEFFEILVRIAHHIYIKNGDLADNEVARALHKLVNEHMLNIQNRQMLPAWQPFRDRQLWTVEINELIEANMAPLQDVFRAIFEKKTPPRKFLPEKIKKSSTMVSIDQVFFFFDYNMIKRMTRNSQKSASRKDKYSFTERSISDKMLRVAFFLSKQTVIDEQNEGEFEYNHISFVEFLEFLARLSHAFFVDTTKHFEWKLNQKLQQMMQWIFVPVNRQVVAPYERDEYQSESDDDY